MNCEREGPCRRGSLNGLVRFTVHSSPFTVLLLACATPLTNRIAVGEEAFVVGIGEGSDGVTDLWAASAGGGAFYRLSFNRLVEQGPRLSPDGRMLAFFRRPSAGGPWALVVLGLENGAERSAALPPEAGPERVGWSADGSRLAVTGAGGSWETPAPPARLRLTRHSALPPWADSAAALLLGRGGQGRVTPCGEALCIAAGGALTPLALGAAGALHWGPDSVGYFAGERFEVRPLAGGRVRLPVWTGRPAGLRELTHHPGQPATGGGAPERR